MLITAKDAHVVPGGVFPPPAAASALMMMMPPPECFHVSVSTIHQTVLIFLPIARNFYYFSEFSDFKILSEQEKLRFFSLVHF